MLITARYTIRPAGPENRKAVAALLQAVHLPVEDLPHSFDTFLVAEKEGHVAGSAGLVIFGDYALLRSLAVHPRQQGTGLGKALCLAAINLALQKGIKEIYLITTTAAHFFGKQGFERVDRINVPAVIQGTSQFSGICPSSATVMRRSIS